METATPQRSTRSPWTAADRAAALTAYYRTGSRKSARKETGVLWSMQMITQ